MNERMPRRARFALVLAFGVMAVAGSRSVQGVFVTPRALGLPPLLSPPDNPTTPAKVALGRKLFFDKRLSSDNSISCATCHDPGYGFADPHPVSVGVKGRRGERN